MPDLRPLPYHERIRDYLKSREPDLWRQFSSEKFLAEAAENARLEILKSAYRLDRETHAALYAQAADVLTKLQLSIPMTLYQSQLSTHLNASLCALPGEGHLVFSGPVLTTLTQPELDFVMGHEFSHFTLWEGWNGEFLVTDRILSAMAAHRRAESSHIETCRLFRLTCEIFADRGALQASADPMVAISALVKLETGLADVNPQSYLAQADEIFSKEKVQARELSHPEAFIRARALKLWSDKGDDAAPEIARMIEGSPSLDELDLLAQERLTELTRRVLTRTLADPVLRSETLLAHARLYFDDFTPQVDTESLPDARSFGPSVQNYLCYVLLDFAAGDPQLADVPLAAAVLVSRELGLEEPFLAIAAKELKLKKKAMEKIREAAGP